MNIFLLKATPPFSCCFSPMFIHPAKLKIAAILTMLFFTLNKWGNHPLLPEESTTRQSDNSPAGRESPRN